VATKASESAVINWSDGRQAGRAEPLGLVHVRVRSEDEDCDEKAIDDTVM
jgi:hypothetical protein